MFDPTNRYMLSTLPCTHANPQRCHHKDVRDNRSAGTAIGDIAGSNQTGDNRSASTHVRESDDLFAGRSRSGFQVSDPYNIIYISNLFLCSGAVIGLLKVGTKDLYLFDEKGQTRKMEQSPSILDFYVHESRQRAGLGKRLFETMLKEEQWTPLKCSVDRPSEKLLAFLGKHYGLLRPIPQANNFVLYEGFFNDAATSNGNRNGHAESPQRSNGLHVTNR